MNNPTDNRLETNKPTLQKNQGGSEIPTPLPWNRRTKGFVSMPGGYTGYVEALRQICKHIATEFLSGPDLIGWSQGRFGLSEPSARQKERFLHNAGVLETLGHQVKLTKLARRWYEALDDEILIGLLHSRLQYFGEMLAELSEEPKSIEELRRAAKKYGLDWDSRTQVNIRRGWLESAKLVEPVGDNRLAITDMGRDLLSKLTVHAPGSDPEPPHAETPPDPTPDSVPTSAPKTIPSATIDEPDDSTADRNLSPAEALALEIREAATDSKNPDRLEFAVRDAFHFLGFNAKKLGGSGKTDVLATAPLGKNGSYSVSIDAKTVGSGSLGDHQVDWVTLEEHRKQHNADYSMLVGPNPSGQRLRDRAADQSVAVLSTEQLADLCIQHAEAPLSLQDYRALFEVGGAVDTTPTSRATEDLGRLRNLAVELCEKLAERTGTFGPLTASQLMVMIDQPDKPSSEQEIQQTLDTLASPLVGAVQGTASTGYVLATAPRVIQQRLKQLGEQIAR